MYNVYVDSGLIGSGPLAKLNFKVDKSLHLIIFPFANGENLQLGNDAILLKRWPAMPPPIPVQYLNDNIRSMNHIHSLLKKEHIERMPCFFVFSMSSYSASIPPPPQTNSQNGHHPSLLT